MSKILVHVNLFNENGKWKYGFDVEVDQERDTGGPDHVTLLAEIDRNQKEVVPGTVIGGHYYVVITDDPEQRRNPTGHFFLNRLYTIEQIGKYFPAEVQRAMLRQHEPQCVCWRCKNARSKLLAISTKGQK